MRLEQKYFIPFMLVTAVITMIVIVISSFRHNQKLHDLFQESLAESDSLLIEPLTIIGENDSLKLNNFQGNPTILVFWASWSDKSIEMLKEIEQFQNEYQDTLSVVAALVKDAKESLSEKKKFPKFIYADGIELFNDLKVPGYPSYILFDEKGKVIHTQVGYKTGVAYDSLKSYLK